MIAQKLNRPLKLLLLATLLSVFCNNANAEDAKWYQVELIVFSHITQSAINSEQWPLISYTNIFKRPVINLTHDDENQAYSLLSGNKLTLTKDAERIAQRNNYKILLHISWQQPFNKGRHSEAIHIYGGNNYAENTSINDTSTDETLPYQSAYKWQLDGLLNVKLQRYFNVHFNFLLSEPTSMLSHIAQSDYFDNDNNLFTYFHLIQSRRMRSKELNFIDHPLYGFLIQITPVKIT